MPKRNLITKSCGCVIEDNFPIVLCGRHDGHERDEAFSKVAKDLPRRQIQSALKSFHNKLALENAKRRQRAAKRRIARLNAIVGRR